MTIRKTENEGTEKGTLSGYSFWGPTRPSNLALARIDLAQKRLCFLEGQKPSSIDEHEVAR